MWIIWSFASALFQTGTDVVTKRASYKTDVYLGAFVYQLLAMTTLVPFVIVSGIPPLKIGYWWGVLASVISMPAWSLLYIYAIKTSPLSVTVPMLAFNPVIVALLSIVFDHRLPSVIGWLGIILICSGLYLLRLEKGVLRVDKGALAMLGVALVWALGAHINKILITASSPIFTAFTVTCIGSITLGIIAWLKGRMRVASVKDHLKHLTLPGMFQGLGEFTLMQAQDVGYTPYVISIKRMSMLFSSISGMVFFGESLSKNKAMGIVLMFIGVLLLINFP
jgi:uncharacterized membrane protein